MDDGGQDIPTGDYRASQDLQRLSAAREYLTLASLCGTERAADAVTELTKASSDPDAARWLLAMMIARPADEGLMAQIHPSLEVTIDIPEDFDEELDGFMHAHDPAGSHGLIVRQKLLKLAAGESGLDLAQRIAEGGGDPALRLVALMRLAASNEAGRRAAVFDSLEGLSAGQTAEILDSFTAPLKAGEQDMIVKRLVAVVSPANAGAVAASHVAATLPRLTDRSLAELIAANWDPALRSEILTDASPSGLVAVLFKRNRLVSFLERDEIDTATSLIVLTTAAASLSVTALREFGRWAYDVFSSDELQPIHTRLTKGLQGAERGEARDALFELNSIGMPVERTDDLAARLVVDDLVPLAGQCSTDRSVSNLGRICACVLGSASEGEVGEIVDSMLGVLDGVSVASFWTGVLGVAPDPFPEWLPSRAVRDDDAVAHIAEDHPSALLAGAKNSDDPETRLRVVRSLANTLADGDLVDIHPGWRLDKIYRSFLEVLAASERADLVADEIRRAFVSRRGAQADRIPTEQLVALLQVSTTLGVHSLPDEAEDVARDLLEDPNERLLVAACEWLRTAAGDAGLLVRAVHDARRSRALANEPLDRLGFELADRRLEVARDLGQPTVDRSNAIRDAGLLDRGSACATALQILENLESPQALRSEAAQVLEDLRHR